MAQPTAFGKYEVTEVLGSGGMAEVYAGMHPDLGRKVAIKVILPQFAAESDFEARFRREARLVASLRHAHIVQLYDFDVVDGRPFMVMEYLSGGTLKERLRSRHPRGARMALPEIADLADAIAGALDYAHGRGAIHRDIKPANILFGAEQEPVLTDFGIAKLLEDAAHLTATGGVVGSPFYMPPEQATGGPVNARSDQYSLGVVLYEMATGRVPFQGSSAVAVMTQHLNTVPPSPRTINAALPAAVEAVLLQALAKRPDDRFASAGELAQAFRQAVAGRRSGTQPAADGAPTIVGDGSAPGSAPGSAGGADAPTVVTGDAPTVAEDRAGTPATPDASHTPRAEPPIRSDPALPARRDDPRGDEPAAQPPAVRPAEPRPPTTQNFNVSGIQAGIVNQGGEQTFSGDLTFNLDFGQSKAAAAQPSAAGTPRGSDVPDLAALLAALRRAFAGRELQHGRADRLARLVTAFHAQLEALPAERADERTHVVKRVQALLMEVTAANPDPDLIEIMGTSLERAVDRLSTVDPDLPTIATRITSWAEVLAKPE